MEAINISKPSLSTSTVIELWRHNSDYTKQSQGTAIREAVNRKIYKFNNTARCLEAFFPIYSIGWTWLDTHR
jgi:hypothetical protein